MQHRKSSDVDSVAESILENSTVSEDDVRRIERDIPSKLSRIESSRGGHGILELLSNVKTLYAMLRDSQYSLSLKTKAIITAALLYVVLPTDLTPDFIPFIGYIDDAAIVAAVVKTLYSEIQDYRTFRKHLN